MITHRRICWPNPDATCLEGGCSYCDDHPFRTVAAIRDYAEHAGVIPNRAIGSKKAIDAFNYGAKRGWPNRETRGTWEPHATPRRRPARRLDEPN